MFEFINNLSDSESQLAQIAGDILKILVGLIVSAVCAGILSIFIWLLVLAAPTNWISVAGPIQVGPFKVTPIIAVHLSLISVFLAGFYSHNTFE
jgi:hypothetical protein